MRQLAWLGVLVLVGCAQTLPPVPVGEPNWQAEADAQAALRHQEAEASMVAARTAPPAPSVPPVPEVPDEILPPKNARAAIGQANGKALVTARPEWFARGALYFPYRAGALYEVVTSISQPTTFVFPQEELLLKYVGLEGNNRWTVFQSDLDDGGVKQSILVVIPNEPKLIGGLTLVTSRTFYNLQLKSQEPTGVLEVRWRHPETTVAQAEKGVPTSTIYHVGYAIVPAKGQPPWVPLKVWDTGLKGKTIIEFSQGLEVMSAPLVYVPNAAGELEQVNYRTRGNRYVIDLVAPRFELRLGVDDASEIVRITRDKDYRAVRCPEGMSRSPIPEECPSAS